MPSRYRDDIDIIRLLSTVLLSGLLLYQTNVKKSNLPHSHTKHLLMAWTIYLQRLKEIESETHRKIHGCVPRRPEVFNSPRQILTLLNKVPGY